MMVFLGWTPTANITYHVKAKINTAAVGSDRTSPNAALHFYLTFMSTDMIFPQCCALTGRWITAAQSGLQFVLAGEDIWGWEQAGTDMYNYSTGDRPAAYERWVSALHWIMQTTELICHTPARNPKPWTPSSSKLSYFWYSKRSLRPVTLFFFYFCPLRGMTSL